MGTLKPLCNGPLYSSTMISIAVDGWAKWVVSCIWYSEEGPGRAVAPPTALLAVPDKCNSSPINGQCTNFILFDVARVPYTLKG